MTATYDFSNAESEDELRKGAIDRLNECAAGASVELDTSALDVELQLGDIIGARDRLTGLAARARVTQKILTIDGRGVTLATKTETL